MKLKQAIIPFLFFVGIAVLFFYKTFLFGQIPFPGDLLIAEYSPWKFYSYLGYTPGSYPNKAQYFDVIRQLYPWKTLSIDQIKNGHIPLWNPYNFSGSPLFANIQSAVFYPLNTLYFIFPQIVSWSILVFLQPLLASFFTYLYAREIGIRKLGSFLSAIAYGYSLFMSVFLEYNTIGHTILWLPLSLYASELMLERATFWSIVLFIGSIVFAFFSGHLQIFGFAIIFVFFYFVFRLFNQEWKMRVKLYKLAIFILGSLISFGICSIQLLPTLELIQNSARVPQSYQFLVDKLLMQPGQLILILSPDFFGNPATRNYLIRDTYPGNALYVGLVPFGLALSSVFLVKRNRYVKFFLLSSFILLLFFIRTPLSELFYQFQIPFLSTGSPTNALFLLSFSLSILSGLGIESLRDVQKKKLYLVPMILLSIFTFFWLMLPILHSSISFKNFLYSNFILIIFVVLFIFSYRFKGKNNIISVLFLFITFIDLFYFFQKFNPFVKKELVFPSAEIFSNLDQKNGVNRFWGYGFASVDPNLSTQYQLFSPDGYDPLYPKKYGEFIQASVDGKVKTEFTGKTRSDAVVTPGFGEKDFASNFYRLRILDVLGVKYILDRVENGSTEKTFPKDRFKLIYEKDGWKIFENLQAAPRLFLASEYKVFKNTDEFEKVFFSKEFDPSKTVLLEEIPRGVSPLHLNDLNLPAGKAGHLSSVELLSYESNKVMVKVITSNPKLLFLSDTYFPGWKAFVDGNEATIYRANYAFRSVAVPTGKHTVVFNYFPESFSKGVKVSIISLILFVLFAIWVSKDSFQYERKN